MKILLRSKNIFVFYILVILASICFYGCTKSIEIKLHESEPKVKVFGVFEEGNPVGISLAYTSSLVDDKLENPISDAKINLYCREQLIEVLNSTGNGLYPSNFIAYAPGDSIYFDLTIDNHRIASGTNIPYPLQDVKITLDTIPKTRPGEDCVLDFTLNFQDPADVANYYEVELWYRPLSEQFNYDFTLSSIRSDDPVIASQAYAQPLAFFTGASAISLPFTDRTFDGKKRTIKFRYFPGYGRQTQNGIVTRYILKHEIIIVFKSITYSYYEYKTSVLRHLLARDADEIFGSSTPVPIVGNVSGGVGIFSCQSSLADTLTINKIIF